MTGTAAIHGGFRFLASGLLLLGAACGGSSAAPSPAVAATPTPVPISPCTVAAPPVSGWNWTRANFPAHILSLVIDEQDGRTWVASSQGPNQVWVTNDAGVTWRAALPGFVDFGSLRSGPAAIYAPVTGTANGLNVSRDHGRSWSVILRPPADVGWMGTVLPSRTRPGLLLVGTQRLPGGNGRPDSIYRSLDDGGTWAEVAFDGKLRYLPYTHFAEDGTGAILAAPPEAVLPGVYFRSTDAGASWQAVDGPSRQSADGLVADTVRHKIYAYNASFAYVTEDGGRSWSRAFGGLASPNALAVDERTGGVFASEGRPDRQGLYYLPDGASTFRAVGLDGIDTWALAVDRCGSIVLAGTAGLIFSSPIPRNP